MGPILPDDCLKNFAQGSGAQKTCEFHFQTVPQTVSNPYPSDIIYGHRVCLNIS